MEDARLLNVALNQIGGEWDADLLARLLIDLRATADRDLTLSGFAEADLQDLLTRFDQREKRARPERFDLDEALAAVDREASGIAPGAGWQLGAHRLFRGDATDAAFVAPWDRPGGGRDSMNQVSIKPGAVQQLAKGFVWSRRRARQVFTSSSWDASAHHCCGQAWLRSWSGGVPPLLGAAAPVLLVISWLVGRVRVTDAAEASGQRQYLSALVLLNFLIVVAALILWWAK